MAEISRLNAAVIIEVSRKNIRRAVDSKDLPERREEKMRSIWIDVEKLREYAKRYNYRIREDLINQFAKN